MSTTEERLALLIAKCKSSSDADVKLEAVNKLQAEFEAGVELFDIDGLISGLKTCLRTPNQHLSTGTLSAIVLLFPLLIQYSPSSLTHTASSNATSVADSAVLRQALNAFLPSGGVFERLGDNRERAREKAKEALIVIGATVVAAAGSTPSGSLRGGKDPKVPETALQIFERYLREQGFLSKSWRIREQSILTLVQLRRDHPSFPLRPFLPQLVNALEDGDGTVRDCAKQSVVEIFTAQGVTDAARTDLKKEMTKRNVRKTIVDSVLLKLLGGGGRPTSLMDSADGKDDYTQSSDKPPTSASNRAIGVASGDADVTPVYVRSLIPVVTRPLNNEFTSMLPCFEGKETEHNWLAREKSVIRIRGMLKGDAYTRYPETFVLGLKNGVLDGTLKALASLRTTVASATCALYGDLAIYLGPGMDPFVETLLIPLLRMAGFTKKIIASHSQTIVDQIITHTTCSPRQTLALLSASMQEKTVQARTYAFGHLKTYVESHGLRTKHSIESTGSIDLLDACLRKGLADPNPGVREKARLLFWSFESIWRDRGLAILANLDATARKQLQNAAPLPLEELGLPKISTPAIKKTSIAAAIAASRAKAKQIATAPPTLRHQATATSHAQHASAARVTSPPARAKRSTSPIVSPRSSSPSPRMGSTSSPPRTSPLRTTGKTSAGHQRQRSLSSSSSVSSPPPSPSDLVHRRRVARSLNQAVIQQQDTLTPRPGSPSNPLSHFKPTTSSTLKAILPLNHQDQSFPIDPNESLLMATVIPLPPDSDLGDEDSVNLINFSANWEPPKPTSQSATSSSPTPSTSRINHIPHSVVEDALRARAAQAESAAEQLLELVDPDDGQHIPLIPPSLLPNNGATPKPVSRTVAVPPVTPVNQSSAVMRQAALFQDSPAYTDRSPSIFELIQERKHQTGWWLKRMSIISQGGHIQSDVVQQTQELEAYIASLQNGTADMHTLRKVVLLCHQNPLQSVSSSSTPGIAKIPASSSLQNTSVPHIVLGGIWDEGNRSERLFSALFAFLRPDKDADILEHGLFILWELLPHLDGRDTDILTILLQLRYAQDFNVDEGTLTIRDAQVELMNERNYALYGLSTMNICLKGFLSQPLPPFASQDARLRGYAFGLVTMAKFIIKLPADILEEELPKIKSTLIEAYLNPQAMVRQAATTAITAAQVILQDETHLFALLEPLPDDKKNLLTYFFEKNNARGSTERVDQSASLSGMERLSKEMDRLDQRISTPPKLRGLSS
ncbi:clasp N terminal-domain-containing protein [Hysterangium stoloniferum]|nr:clasp N terminal-domain-containing protein [Hysterangium stoloniferum]